MKKFLSLILALVMVMSLSVTAFAEGEQGGTTTLTANIPNAAEPSYTIHIPADTTLEYGNTDRQLIGVVEVTDVQNYRNVSVKTPYTLLINTADPADTISWKLSLKSSFNGRYYEMSPEDGLTPNGYDYSLFSTILGYNPSDAYAQVEDWSAATPGATYQAVITFQFNGYN